MQPARLRIWGPPREGRPERGRAPLVDLFIAVGLAGLLYGLSKVGGEWTEQLRAHGRDRPLAAGRCPRYTFFSLSRGLIAYVLSLGFTLVYGYWAAKDHARRARARSRCSTSCRASRCSASCRAWCWRWSPRSPRSNIGLELAAVLMIFTGQAWNMTFSFYHSLRAIPREQHRGGARSTASAGGSGSAGSSCPSPPSGLVWNSMMSMAGGWFFLMISEAFVLGDKDFRLPGLGSYMSVAVGKGDVPAPWSGRWSRWSLMIVVLDQLLWRPLVVWAQKFRVEEGGQQEAMSLVVLRLAAPLARAPRCLARLLARARHGAVAAPARAGGAARAPRHGRSRHALARCSSPRSSSCSASAAYKLVLLFGAVPRGLWLHARAARPPHARPRAASPPSLGTLWACPAGIAVGLSPRLSRLVQPVAQVAASFPAPMLFPAVIAVLHAAAA